MKIAYAQRPYLTFHESMSSAMSIIAKVCEVVIRDFGFGVRTRDFQRFYGLETRVLHIFYWLDKL